MDAAKPTELGTPWLDVWLMCEGLDLCVHAHGVEHAWRSQALHGTVGQPTKFRLMPFQGVDLVYITLLKGVLNGRLTRLKSLDLTLQDKNTIVLYFYWLS